MYIYKAKSLRGGFGQPINKQKGILVFFALVVVTQEFHSIHAFLKLSSEPLGLSLNLQNLEWNLFQKRFNKHYSSREEANKAKSLFLTNLLNNFLHNLNENFNYTLGIHEYSDKSPEEAIEILCGTDVPAIALNVTRRSFVSSRKLNEKSVNWVEKGKVSPVMNQGKCGSCWAFTAAQALEGQLAICDNQVRQISKQQLVDCAEEYGNDGCDGGWPVSAMYYLMNEGGAVNEACYPYRGQVETCDIDNNCDRFSIEDVIEVGPSGDEDAVANALAEKGPLAIAIHVDDNMVAYSGGIYHSDTCDEDVNHGVLLVGYGTDKGQPYWLIKNSWGTSWGEKGYLRLARNQGNMCKVSTYPSYPVVNC